MKSDGRRRQRVGCGVCRSRMKVCVPGQPDHPYEGTGGAKSGGYRQTGLRWNIGDGSTTRKVRLEALGSAL